MSISQSSPEATAVNEKPPLSKRPKSNKILPCKTISGPPAVLTGEGIKLPCVFEAVREIYRNILATASFEKVDRFRSEIQLAGHPLRGLNLHIWNLVSMFLLLSRVPQRTNFTRSGSYGGRMWRVAGTYRSN
ncbi:hypothetical protein TNCV_45581 [Trichonephila clavipes]|nr:hypothetical protein TNCV_45581 [Trichonephila clavipes]